MRKIQNNLQNLCWIRQVEIRFYSSLNNSKIIYDGEKTRLLDIKVHGSKYLSSLKDKGSISISNLTYSDIVTLILGQYYHIEIWAGYKTTGLKCFFKGAVSYISDKIQARRDNTCYILFSSELVAAYSQKRMNLTLNSGINLYAAFNYICLTNGIDPIHLPQSLRKEFLQEVITNYNTPASLVDQIAQNTNSFSLNSDNSIDGYGIVNFSDLSDKRVIKVNQQTINFTKGNPTVDKDGLHITLLPTFCFQPGDIIIIDNALLSEEITDAGEVTSNFKTNYIDRNGAYMIIELNYDFETRGPSFGIDVKARALSIITNIIGAK